MRTLKKYPLIPYNKEFHPGYEHRKIDFLLDEDSNGRFKGTISRHRG